MSDVNMDIDIQTGECLNVDVQHSEHPEVNMNIDTQTGEHLNVTVDVQHGEHPEVNIDFQQGAAPEVNIDFQQGVAPEINIETAPPGPKGDKGDPGDDGVSATHRWDGTTLTVTSASGTSSADLKGPKGDPGGSGPAGVGIESIEQTVVGLGGGAVNTWQIQLTDGQKQNITLYNGDNGVPGKDGFSPTITANETDKEITLTVTDVNGTHTVSIPRVPPSMGEPGVGTSFVTDETLTLENGVLSVNTTNDMEQDNTLPITSAGVYATVGNIEALLKTI